MEDHFDKRRAFSMKRSVASGKFLVLLAFSLAISIVATTLQGTSAQADSSWGPSSILNVLKQGAGQVVIAHRGLYGPGCPENSICSIERTYTSHVEGIELDVKQSKNLTPWLFHEQNVGRLIHHSPAFNPFQDKNPPDGWNPTVDSLTDTELGKYYLLDKSLKNTGYHPVSLDRAFDTITRHGWDRMVIVLDIKNLDAVSRAANLAIKYGLQNAVVLKFSSSLIADHNAYSNLQGFTKGLPFVPTMYAPDMANIMRNLWRFDDCGKQNSLATYQCTIKSWIRGLQAQPGYAWLEVGNKLPVDSDPTNFLLRSKDLGAVGGFQPVPEYPDRTGPGRSYVRSNGTCCASNNDYLTAANRWFPAETRDSRENIHSLWDHGFLSVITDDPLAAIKAASNRAITRYVDYDRPTCSPWHDSDTFGLGCTGQYIYQYRARAQCNNGDIVWGDLKGKGKGSSFAYCSGKGGLGTASGYVYTTSLDVATGDHYVPPDCETWHDSETFGLKCANETPDYDFWAEALCKNGEMVEGFSDSDSSFAYCSGRGGLAKGYIKLYKIYVEW